jgi:hypothetical protein
MTKLSLYIAVLALFAGVTATLQDILHNGQHSAPSVLKADARHAASAAFRDGLYLGRLAAEEGSPMRVASGRWATDGDRTLFAAGYRQGYHEFLVNRAATGAARHAE